MVACVIDGGWTIEATADRFQVDYAKDQEMKTSKGSYVFANDDTSTTNNFHPYPELPIDANSTPTTGGLEPQQSVEPEPEPSPTPSQTPSPSATPSAEETTPAPQETTPAPEQTTAAPEQTTTAPEPTPTSTGSTDSDDPGDGKVLSAPIRPAAEPSCSGRPAPTRRGASSGRTPSSSTASRPAGCKRRSRRACPPSGGGRRSGSWA